MNYSKVLMLPIVHNLILDSPLVCCHGLQGDALFIFIVLFPISMLEAKNVLGNGEMVLCKASVGWDTGC